MLAHSESWSFTCISQNRLSNQMKNKIAINTQIYILIYFTYIFVRLKQTKKQQQ